MRKLIVLLPLITIFLYGCTSIEIKEEDVTDQDEDFENLQF